MRRKTSRLAKPSGSGRCGRCSTNGGPGSRLAEISAGVGRNLPLLFAPVRLPAHATYHSMKARFASVVVSLASLLWLSACAKVPKPGKFEIEQTFANLLPAFARVYDFSLEEMQNSGTEDDPTWHARFRAKVK